MQLNYPEATMYEMIRRIAARYPKEPAYEFYGVRTSYKRFVARIDAAAAAFSAAGIGVGDAVTICLPNVPQALDCFYALDAVGAIANMVHPLSAQNEIAYYLNVSHSRMILTVDLFYEKVEAALASVDHPVTVLVCRMQDELPPHLKCLYVLKKGREYLKFPNTDHATLWRGFLKTGRGFAPAAYDRNRTSVILYSGGTSGVPKGICLTDYSMNALAVQAREMVPEKFRVGLSMLSCMPVFHGFGLGINIHTVLVHGARCILMPTFNNKTYAQALIKKKPNFIAGVPTIFEALLHIPDFEGVKLDYLLGVFCGGDSMSVELKHKVDDFLASHGAKVRVQQGYGLTECVTASCLTPKDRERPGSIGLPFPDMVYAIVKPGTGEPLPPGEAGEIILTGPTLMQGYLNQPQETAEALRWLPDAQFGLSEDPAAGRLWLYTGDLGSMDEAGFVYFRQRIKRMIVTNGYNVYPGQLENVIDGVDEVAYSCVIGVKDARRGQRVRAYVVLREGVAPTEAVRERIMAALRLNVAAYALPRELEFRESLPRTLVGKVAYRRLEEEAEEAAA